MKILFVFALYVSLICTSGKSGDSNFVVLGRFGAGTKRRSSTSDIAPTQEEYSVRLSIGEAYREATPPPLFINYLPTKPTSGTTGRRSLRAGLTGAVIPTQTWEQQRGREFIENQDWIDDLVQTSLELATTATIDKEISWKLVSEASSLDKDVNVWVGKSIRKDGFYGSQLPWMKSQSYIPYKPQEVVELLMDSSRVKVYNPWTLGRRDLWTDGEHTKIVKSKTQPPLGSKQIISTTFMHARPVQDGWIVVSRGVGDKAFREEGDDSCGRSDFLLGVNYVTPVKDGNSCQLINIAHVYSPALPQMLAERLGVKSAIQYVKDLRKAKESL